MDAKRREHIMDEARAAGFDPSHLTKLELILKESPQTSLAQEVADTVVDKMRQEGIDYFPQLPNIILNASLLASHALSEIQVARGGMDIFRSVNTDAVNAALAPLAQAEGQLAKITDSLAQVSQLLLGEDLDKNTTKEEQTAWITNTVESSPKQM